MSLAIVIFVFLLDISNNHKNQAITTDASQIRGTKVRLIYEFFQDKDETL